jgi:hypothetical protein
MVRKEGVFGGAHNSYDSYYITTYSADPLGEPYGLRAGTIAG